MRVDKFLWCTRYYKTRTLATNACKNNRVKVNDEIVKPSREVYPQDKITVRKQQINYQLKINDIPESRIGAKLIDIAVEAKCKRDIHSASGTAVVALPSRADGSVTLPLMP